MQNRRNMVVLACALTTLIAACGGGQNTESDKSDNTTAKQQIATATQPRKSEASIYQYRVVREHLHSPRSYTQGLQYYNNTMWEGTGHEGESHLQRIDLKTGKVDIVASLPNDEFGEGITLLNDRIYQLTWYSERAYVYNLKGDLLDTKRINGEGWGLTTDGKRLYMSNGTSDIRIIDPTTFNVESNINVTLNGAPLELINELEWIDGRIWANIYMSDAIVSIDPATGCVEGYVDLSALRTLLKRNPEAEAFNGIAYDSKTGHMFVTGKDWNRIFEIEIIK